MSSPEYIIARKTIKAKIIELSSARGSLFKCQHCNYACNADYNGAVNIMKRAMGYMLMAWAGLT
ncbi:MAG: zinc ribbon domain-containing protein, partial [Thermoproteota archaeon]